MLYLMGVQLTVPQNLESPTDSWEPVIMKKQEE